MAASDPVSIDEIFHAHGLRVTSQRRRVVAALHHESHLTPEQVATAVAADGGDPLPASTVYRTLDTLEGLGVVAHTHLTHGAPTYHLSDHARHLHLVCRRCGAVQSAPIGLADELRRRLRDEVGFEADVEHMGIHGTCESCAADGDDAPAPAVPAAHDHDHPHLPRTSR